MNDQLVSLIVPSDVLEHFDFEGYEELSGVYRIHLVEKDDLSHIPKTIFHSGKTVLDGYMNPVELQTYPLKGKEVFLVLRRRRWKLKGSTEGHSNSYDFHEKGMKATRKFGLLLKEIGRG